ncbi:hypothetical protein HK101_004738 [Irineochytrium annulatum]|nr:hypothetical protein HK101_004738 [Irineochytrium annulatum]
MSDNTPVAECPNPCMKKGRTLEGVMVDIGPVDDDTFVCDETEGHYGFYCKNGLPDYSAQFQANFLFCNVPGISHGQFCCAHSISCEHTRNCVPDIMANHFQFGPGESFNTNCIIDVFVTKTVTAVPAPTA